MSAKIPGISDSDFQEAANTAKENCPVSKVLAGAEITMDAKFVN
jgi:osmotically inducible protein OsmC